MHSDAEGATEIARYDSGSPFEREDWFGETLYRKPNGEFLLEQNGGYGSVMHNSRSVVPISEQEAIDWLVRRGHLAIAQELGKK